MAKNQTELRPLQRLALFFFTRTRTTALLALAVTLFGLLSYTTLLKREGFPSIDIPYAIGQTAYFVGDSEKVDTETARPLSEFLLKQPGVKSVKASSLANFGTVFVQFNEDVDVKAKSAQLQKAIATQSLLPEAAEFKLEPAQMGFTMRGDDAVVSFYSPRQANVPEPELVAEATKAAMYLKEKGKGLVKDASIISPVEDSTNPLTGESATVQAKFERYGVRVEGENKFYSSIPIGVSMTDGGDVVEFGNKLEELSATYSAENGEGYKTSVSASYAPSIKQQITELQKTLLEGLLAVLIIGSIVIAVRASFVTVISMVVVLLATLGLLEIIGYTLNTITLFSLILALSLIVDDTIIMVEALDAQRKKRNNQKDIVRIASGKVGKAMIAATTTAGLSFAPLLFVGGVLGGFIRAIPVTIISALVISLIVALVFIPFIARFVLLGKKHVGKHAEHELAEDFERKVAEKLATPMLWAQHSRKRLALVCSLAILLSLTFIGASGAVMSKVKFNIFPPSKDTNQMLATLTFKPGTTIDQAEDISDAFTTKLAGVLGEDFAYSANYGQANAQTAEYYIELKDYNHRKTTAPQYIDEIKNTFKNFDGASVGVRSIDAGPPGVDFTARIRSEGKTAEAQKLAGDIVAYLKSANIKRLDGSKVQIESVSVDNTDVVTRDKGERYVGVTAKFKDTDTSALVQLTQASVEKQFTPEKIASYGLDKKALSFDFGQEDENMDSFKTLLVAFPLVLLAIYLVLAVQFRSLLQPLLIFLAIPFSLLGVTLGLWLTDNPMSFFAMLGFFALIGLSIKNTILLTDYANQARRAGMNPVEATHEALAERFRPLIATSLTAIVSIIPLALTSPFWQGLAVVLMFGLLSSTFLVVTVYPYYYLMGEFLRGATRRTWRKVFRRA